jgi:hypothetical protein
MLLTDLWFKSDWDIYNRCPPLKFAQLVYLCTQCKGKVNLYLYLPSVWRYWLVCSVMQIYPTTHCPQSETHAACCRCTSSNVRDNTANDNHFTVCSRYFLLSICTYLHLFALSHPFSCPASEICSAPLKFVVHLHIYAYYKAQVSLCHQLLSAWSY